MWLFLCLGSSENRAWTLKWEVNQQRLQVSDYTVSQYQEVSSNRELLLGNIGEGNSRDHVLREAWRKRGHLWGGEGGGGVQVERGQRVGEQVWRGKLTRPEGSRIVWILDVEGLLAHLWEFGRNSSAVPGWGSVGRLGSTLEIPAVKNKILKLLIKSNISVLFETWQISCQLLNT